MRTTWPPRGAMRRHGALLFAATFALVLATTAQQTPPPPGSAPPPKAPRFDVQETSTQLFLDIAVIMLVCRFVGIIFQALGQPVVIGEIIAGIMLGPSVMGLAHPCPTGSSAPTAAYPSGAPCDARNPTLILFPTHTPFQAGPSNIRNYLNVCAQLGVVVFMFVVGLEVDVPKLKKTSGKASLIALASVAVPFCLGAFALAPYLHVRHDTVTVAGVAQPVPELSFQLFVGTCLAVTAFPVLARIITEKGLHKLHLGSMTLACAALTDVIAWALLAVVLAVQKSQSDASGSGKVQYKPVLVQLALIVVVVAGQWLVVAPVMRQTVFRHYLRRSESLSPNRLAWVLICMLLSAWLMHLIGFHAMLGSFVFGLVFPRGEGAPFLHTILAKVEPFATLVLLPLFFMVTGLSIDLTRLGNTKLELLYILLVASGGKFLGSGVVAKLCKLSWRHSVAVGVMMNTRGLTEIVVLNIAQQAGIIDDEVFSMLVLMAIITTAMAGPLLWLIFPPKQLVAEHAAELAEKAAARGVPPDDGAARLVVLPHDIGATARLLQAAVATLAPGMRAHVSVARFSTPADVHARGELGTGLLLSPEALHAKSQLEEQLRAVARPNLSSEVTAVETDDTLRDALVHIRARAPQLLVTDWPAGAEDRSRLRALVLAAPCTVVLWGGGTVAAAAEVTPTAMGTPPVAAVTEADAPRLPLHRRVTALLLNEAAQDKAVDAASAKVHAAREKLSERLPPWLRCCGSTDSDDEDADGSMAGVKIAAELPPHHAPDGPTKGVSAAAAATRVMPVDAAPAVVTPHTMAVAAASSLSPKFSKLIVTGWPAGERERAELVAFVHDVERDAVGAAMRRASRQASHLSLHSPGGLLRRPFSGGDVSVPLQQLTPPPAEGAEAPPPSPPPSHPAGDGNA